MSAPGSDEYSADGTVCGGNHNDAAFMRVIMHAQLASWHGEQQQKSQDKLHRTEIESEQLSTSAKYSSQNGKRGGPVRK